MKILTPAKINLTLEILGRRSDNYHDLATWMLPVGLYDELEIELGNESSFSSNAVELANDPANLVIQAIELFHRTAGTVADYKIRLEKEIPLGAGLGGGSSDAAATLLLLNTLHGLPLTADQLCAVAAKLGSDVAFFIEAQSAWCTSRGEVMEPREFSRDLWILLTKPEFKVSTTGAYQAYASLPKARGQEIASPWGRLRNDLEPAVFPKYVLLAVIKNWLAERSQTIFSLMSGSGSTIFAIVESQSEGNSLRDAFRRVFGGRVWTCVCRLNPEPVAGGSNQ